MDSKNRQRAAWCSGLAILVLVLVGDPATALAGPWVKAPGESYMKLSGEVFDSDRVFDVGGELDDSAYTYSHRSVRAYAEVGVLPSVALNFSVPFIASSNTLNERVSYNRWGPGDLDLAVQARLLDGPCAASIAPGARLPLYDETVGEGGVNVASGASASQRYVPALGDGSVDLVATGAFGCSLHPVPAWVSLQAGPRLRMNGFGESLDYGLDAGYFVWPERLALTGRLGGVQRLSDDNERPTKSFVSVGGGFLLNIYEGFALEAGASYIPSGAFVARGWTADIGISFTGEVFSNPYD
ncbi:MAG: hypothetical protein ACLFVJ_01545 [Persicimonas sp.]